MFPYKQISSPKKMYKDIFSGASLEWLILYAKIHKLNIKSIQNKDDITFATEKIIAYEMPAETAYEIDEESDWLIVEELMKKNGI